MVKIPIEDDTEMFAEFALIDKLQNRSEMLTPEDVEALKELGIYMVFDAKTESYILKT
jgi:hypothetical protein